MILTLLLANTFILAALIVSQPLWREINIGIPYALSNLDHRRDEGVFARRLSMTVTNQIENLCLVIPISVIALSLESSPGAAIATITYLHIGARFAYVAVTLFGIPYIRSIVWAVGFGTWGILTWKIIQSM